MSRLHSLTPFRLAGLTVWAVALVGSVWMLVALAVSGFTTTTTLLPVGVVLVLLLTVFATLIRPDRRFGKTLALYVIGAAVVAVTVSRDLTAGAALWPVVATSGLVICAWVCAGLLILDRARQRRTPDRVTGNPLAAGAGALVLSVALVFGTAVVLPDAFADRSTSAAPGVPPSSTGLTAVSWTGADGNFLDYPDQVTATTTGFLVRQATSVQAYDGASGALRWQYSVPSARGFQAVTSLDGTTVVLSFRPGPGAAVGDAATRLLALETDTGRTRWQTWLPGSALPSILAVTSSHLLIRAAEGTAWSLLRRSLIDGAELSPVPFTPDADCPAAPGGPTLAGGVVLMTVSCGETDRLLAFDPETGGVRWRQDVDLAGAPQLTTGAGSTGLADPAALVATATTGLALSAITAAGADPEPAQILGTDGAELFALPAAEQLLRVLDHQVISWRAGTLVARPLSGAAPYDLVGDDGCRPTENSDLIGFGTDQVLAGCTVGDSAAVALFGPHGAGAALVLPFPADADLWLTAVPGGVVAYDSVSGTMVGLG